MASQPQASQAPQTAAASPSLYVGDLAPDVSEVTLFEHFADVGPVASVRVCRDATTRRSLGYAYVNFHSITDAERALDTMNFTLIRGKPCRIMWSQRDPSVRKSGVGNVFVNHLHKSVDNKALFDTFSIFGNILSVKVATSNAGESLGYGFVHFQTEEAATAAIEKVNGMVINDQVVSVSHFKSKNERGGVDKSHFTNVYVKHLPEDVTEEELKDLFAEHGEITSVFMPTDANGKSKGFAFVNFSESKSAVEAVDELNGKDYKEKKLYVGRAQKKEERERELREKGEKVRQDIQKKYQGVNLYIKNLSDEMTEERLREIFAAFGTITSAKIAAQGSKSRGFGFVCYSNPEEATKAITEMNGKMIDQKPLYVALHQPKEIRRAQLEAYYARMKPNIPPPMFQNPMFFQNMPRMMPYQQVGPRRWQQGAGAPQMMNVRPQYMNPMNRPQRGGRPPRSQPPKSLQGPNVPPNVPRPRGAPFKTFQNPRMPSGQVQRQVPMPLIAPNQPLTSNILASADPQMQKQLIGERLYPLIHSRQPELAAKITGMLLEMDNGELLILLESPESLNEKISEALEVLETHKAVEPQEE